MDKDIEPCPKNCSKFQKNRVIAKVTSKKKNISTTTTKTKPASKSKQIPSKKKVQAQPLLPALSKEEITMDQDITRLLVYNRHQTFPNNHIKTAKNPLSTKGRLSNTVAKPSLLTTKLLDIAKGKVNKDLIRKNNVNRISNFNSWTPIKKPVVTQFNRSPKDKVYEMTQKALTESICKKQCNTELTEDLDIPWYTNDDLQQESEIKVSSVKILNTPDQHISLEKEINEICENFPKVIARITSELTRTFNEDKLHNEEWHGQKTFRIYTCDTNDTEEIINQPNPTKVRKIEQNSPTLYVFTSINLDNNIRICKDIHCEVKNIRRVSNVALHPENPSDTQLEPPK